MPTALVTGTRRGIGRAVARRLAGSGWTVFAGVRDLTDWEVMAESDQRITPVSLDVTDQARIDAGADALPDRLDALINNAAFAVLGPVETLTTADLRRQFEVNVVGTVAVTRAVLPRLRTAAGRIVFISSVGSRSVVPMEGAYCASKCAVEGIADALRVELRPWRIAVSVVEPGPTDTETWREVDAMIDDMHARMSPHHRDLYAQHVVGLRKNIARFGSAAAPPDAVVRAVEHALTARRPRARYVVGAPARTMVAMRALLPTRTGDAIGARIAGLT
ncbi:retinol dehydrogenase [Microbacterium sp. B35-04]|uniref:SDR family oxidoreductase n=1 Tax=Microbacterium sp. B35-04 TaxID=1961716 RepID=UPI0013D1FA0F|nr:SDR family oxidoreductase [Microbacterium sp. B35-04]KAF2413150.1 retinol dehydrogenase [Microbacterium sp. B35-04]